MHTTGFLTRVMLVLTLSWFLPAIPAQAEWWRDTSHEPTSAYWWTLSETVTPDQLKEALVNPQSHRHRYAVADLERVTKVKANQIRAYLDGTKTPELIPFWRAFSAFAHRFEDWPDWPERAPDELRAFGISDEGIFQLVQASNRANLLEASAKEQIWPKAQELVRLQKKYPQPTAGTKALETLSKDSGKSLAELQSLRGEAGRSPAAEAALATLEELREQLPPSDWQRFRLMLLERVAPGIFLKSSHDGLGDS